MRIPFLVFLLAVSSALRADLASLCPPVGRPFEGDCVLQCFAFQTRMSTVAPEARTRITTVCFRGVNHSVVLVADGRRVYFWDALLGLVKVGVSVRDFDAEKAQSAAEAALEIAVHEYVLEHGKLPDVLHRKPAVGPQEAEFVAGLARHVGDASPLVYRARMADGSVRYALAASNGEFIGVYSPQYGARLFPCRPQQSLALPAFEKAALEITLKAPVAEVERITPATLIARADR